MRTGFREKLGFLIYQLISWTMIALCVWMIHGFSQENAGQSDSLSLEVTDVVVRIFQPEGRINRSTQSFMQLHTYVRKGAHALEYAMLALAAMTVLAPFRMRPWKKVLLVLILCVAFAGFDEWSQRMSTGRAPAVRDVLIDSAGALAGCIAALLIRQMVLWDLRHRASRRSGRKQPRKPESTEIF